MLKQAKVAAISAAALMMSAMPAFGFWGGNTTHNFAVVKGNDVSSYANSGKNAQLQVGGGYFSGQKQKMATGFAGADAQQAIVVNSNACGCPEDNQGFGSNKTTNVAVVKYNDVSAAANSGKNLQVQFGKSHQSQSMWTGDAVATGAQWIVVNSQGALSGTE